MEITVFTFLLSIFCKWREDDTNIIIIISPKQLYFHKGVKFVEIKGIFFKEESDNKWNNFEGADDWTSV